MTRPPPRIARAVIRLLTPREDRPFVLSDLDDRFDGIRRGDGERAARRWYRRQAVVSIPVLLVACARAFARGLSGGEVRRSFRTLRRRPRYSIGVAGTLALGFASAVVLGDLAWQVWLEPLPLPDSERLVRVYELEPADGSGERTRFPVSPPLLDELRAREWRHLTGFAGILDSSPEWSVDGEVRHLTGATVSPGFFEVLGVVPLHGRAEFRGRDGEEPAEAVLTEDFWIRAFGGDPDVVGTTLDLGGHPHTVVGIVPQNGEYPERVDVFTPLLWESHQLAEGFRGARYVEAVGRVAPVASVETASEEFAAFAQSLGTSWPSHAGWGGELVMLRTDLVRPFRAVLRLLLVAGLAFLALSIVNVFGLSMARALERSGEAAVRRALGASRSRLRRAALIEGALLGLAGGAGALVLARAITAVAIGWLPEDMPRTSDLGLTPGESIVGVALAVAVGAVVVAVARSLVAPRERPGSGGRVSPDLVGGRTIVIGQFALTTVLVVVGALAVERSLDLAQRDLGFEADGVWTGIVALPDALNAGWEQRRDTWTALLSEIEARGHRAAIATNPPMSGSNNRFDYRRSATDDQRFGQYSIVSPEYFDLMGIRIEEGRTFQRGESDARVIISRALADEVFPGESPVGLTLSILQQDREIIGVAESIAHFGPDAPPTPMMYASYEAENWSFTRLVVAGDDGVPDAVRDALQRAVPGAAPVAMIPYRRHLSEWFRPLRIQLGIVGGLAALGGLLATLGLYSAISFRVQGRLPELGIRVALGATRGSIVRGIVTRAVSTAVIGLLIGFALAWVGRGVFADALGATGIGPSAGAIGVTALAVLGLAALGVVAPARRAVAADPLETFRVD